MTEEHRYKILNKQLQRERDYYKARNKRCDGCKWNPCDERREYQQIELCSEWEAQC